MNELTQKLINFCEDKTQSIFDLSASCSAIRSRSCLIKASLGNTIIGLLLEYKSDLEMLFYHGCHTGTSRFEFVGFYSTTTKQLYMSDSFRYNIELVWKDEGHHDFPIEYKPLPINDMLNVLAESLDKELAPVGPGKPLDIYNMDAIQSLANAFFESKKIEIHLSGESLLHAISNLTVEKFLRIRDVELYLNDPNAWLNYAKDVILQNKRDVEEIIDLLKSARINLATIEAVKCDPNHIWHKQAALMQAVAGKKVVTVKTKTDTFKYQVEGLLSVDGKYSLYFLGTNTDYRGLKPFTIHDIECIMYRGKVIYGNTEIGGKAQ